MTRILHCIAAMAGGGGQRQLVHLVEAQLRAGLDAQVAVILDGPGMAALAATGAVIHRLCGAHYYDPRCAASLVRVLRASSPDIVQAWGPPMELYAGLAARRTRTPWILNERSAGPWTPGVFGYVRNSIRLWSARSASAVVANSAGACDRWRPRLAAGLPCRLVPNILPLDAIAHARPRTRAEFGLRADQPVILAAGRMSPSKNWPALIEALRDVMARTSAVAFFCGEGPMRERIEDLVMRSGLDKRVFFHGYVPDLWSWLHLADVCVSTSASEGCPNVVLEAMAAGCPLVVSDIPAHRELLSDETAAFAPASDPSEIARSILAVLSDPAGAQQRSGLALTRARENSAHASVEALNAVYADVLACRTSGPKPVR